MEYADGFEFNPLYEYQYSSGTMVQYRHYALSIPNSNLKLKLSGNYILRVVKQSNRQEIVLQQQFRVYEPKVKIDAWSANRLQQAFNATPTSGAYGEHCATRQN
jgi:hypothetical protein